MHHVRKEKFKVRNLDCAVCAAKIEQALRKVEGVEEASLNFATLTLHLKASDIPRALAEVKRIEPEVVLTPSAAGTAQGGAAVTSMARGHRKEITIIIVAIVIFLAQLFFEKSFHDLNLVWLEYVITFSAYLLAGGGVLLKAGRTIRRGQLFDENVLMAIATIGAIVIHQLPEAVGVMLFFKVGELLQDMAVSRSRRSVQGLLAARPDHALVKADYGLVEMAPEQVKVGDIILVKPGEKVPLDGEVIEGVSQLDTSPLTGEPVPVQVRIGDSVLAGVINNASAITLRVSKPFEESSIARILELVENAASRKTATEKFITTFARYYTPAVVAIAAAIAIVPPLLIPGAEFSTWIYRALVLLVISCPCALLVSIPLGYFGGIGRASAAGILVKGSTFIDTLSQVKTVVMDKTGTLTRGVFELERVVVSNGFTDDQVLEYAAAAELHSDHPIANSIVKALEEKSLFLDEDKVSDHVALAGMGVSATYDGRKIIVGNDAYLHKENIEHGQCEFESTVANVVVDGTYAGYLLIGDKLKPGARQAMDTLRKNGVDRLIMLTGDNKCSAAAMAKELGLDDFHSDLLPEEKVELFEKIAAQSADGGKIAYLGDGINDAPVLARADVGVAMGGYGSDAAIETADVVLMTDSPAKMAEALDIARFTRVIVWQNIILALTIKGVFLVLGALGMATMWEAVFADVGTALLALLNATRALGIRKKSIDS